MSLALLALPGFSVVLLLEQPRLRRTRARRVPGPQHRQRAGLRLALVAGSLGTAALPVAAASVALLIGRRRAAARLERLARLLAPLILLVVAGAGEMSTYSPDRSPLGDINILGTSPMLE